MELASEFLRAVEEAAIASARTMGRDDRILSDQAAVEAMRCVLTRSRWQVLWSLARASAIKHPCSTSVRE